MNDKEYWSQYWKQHHERPHHSTYLDEERNKRILKLIQNPTAKEPSEIKILEVGCGPAINLCYFKQLGYNCYGVDYSEEAVMLANHNNVEIVCADARDLPFESELFDLVYSAGLVEHYANKENMLNEMVRVCKHQGKIIATVPNLLHPWTVIKKFTKNKLFRIEETFNPKSLEYLLNSVQLSNIQIEGICADPCRVVKPGLIKFLDNDKNIATLFGVELIGSGTKSL